MSKKFTNKLAIHTTSLLAVCCVFGLLLQGYNGKISAQALPQAESLALESRANGFSGKYLARDKSTARSSPGKTLLVETRHPSKDFSLSRIQRQDGSTLAECLRDQNIVTVSLPGVKLAIDISTKKFLEEPEWEQKSQEIENFILSDDGKTTRAVLSQVIMRRMKEEQPYLFGFIVIAMVVGEEPLSTDAQKEAAWLTSPKQIKTPSQMFVAYRAHAQATKLGVPVNKLCAYNSTTVAGAATPSKNGASLTKPVSLNAKSTTPAVGCFGCCGPDCWGCTGCYTAACALHDGCVALWGQAACAPLLPAAIASLAECALNLS